MGVAGNSGLNTVECSWAKKVSNLEQTTGDGNNGDGSQQDVPIKLNEDTDVP